MKQPEHEADHIRVVWALSVCLALFCNLCACYEDNLSVMVGIPHSFKDGQKYLQSLRHSSFRRMSMDKTVAEYTEEKTAARKGADMYPIGDDILYSTTT